MFEEEGGFEEHCWGIFPTTYRRKRSSLRRIFSHLEPTLRGFLLRPSPNPTPHPLNWNKIMADSSSPPSPSICCRELWKSCQKGQKNVLSRQKNGQKLKIKFFIHSFRGRPDISVYHAQTIFTASYKIFPLNLGLESVNRELQYESIKQSVHNFEYPWKSSSSSSRILQARIAHEARYGLPSIVW